MSTFHTFDDHNREHDHHPDVELGGLDDEIRRHRQIAADMNRSPHDREVAAVKAATIRRCIYLLRGKSLVGVGAATLYLLHRFHRAVVVSTASAAITGATIVAVAAPLSPANHPHIAATPPVATRQHPTPARHHPARAGASTGRHQAGGTGPELAGGPAADQQPQTSHATNRATRNRATVGTPPPTVAPTTQARTTAPPTKIPDPEPTKTTPTSQPTQPTTEPTSPTPTSTGHDPILKVTLPLPLPTIKVGPILGVN